MCRTTDFHGSPLYGPKPNQHHRTLTITAFQVRLSGVKGLPRIPDSLTLLYTNSDLFLSGSKIRPGSNAFLSLHRVVNVKTEEGEVIFWSREPVRATESVRFEVYLGEERVLEGSFVRDEEEWRLNCRSGLDGEAADVAEAEVSVTLGGRVALSEKVVMKRRKKSTRRRNRLEVIPEESEESDGGWCEWEEAAGRFDGGECLEEMCGPDLEMDLEGVSWAVDVGLWVMCFGVGFLVSKASARSLRRLRLLRR